MSFLNTPIPVVEAFVRGNFLRNNEDSHDKKFSCYIFGMCSIPSQAPLFHFVMEDGGLWWRMPIHAFCWKENAPEQELDELVLWDSFSYHVGVTSYPILKNKVVKFISRRREKYQGKYLFTLDWASSSDASETDFGLSEFPSQHKCGHFIAMDNGNFAIQPNNRLTVHDPSFTVKENLVINRKYNTTLWTAERNARWVTPDTDIMNYDHTDLKNGESNKKRSDTYNQLDNETINKS
jgi:hypothetical protein